MNVRMESVNVVRVAPVLRVELLSRRDCLDSWSRAAAKVFTFGDLTLRRTAPEAPAHLSALWPRIVPLGLLAWKAKGIAWVDLSDAIGRHQQC